ncbi:hypothetical protein GCK72_022956 [Caenorhabditis remanei]|uniref:Uncharacterized protein n=1 Tax=Caenorhabditis remanei TaxID=31234 RepID=A0A6A5FV43_CAERE|nr:hypothetical protein GCK72_022956 [Caenorhabditis remanei]KAF1746500.1 hypothetical protein GCK72_022956 [Caenorhabditis remanei]
MIGRKRFKKEIPVPLTPEDRMNKSKAPCVMFDCPPKSAPPVYGYSLNRKARDGSKFECLSPHSDSRHSLGNNFFFSRPNSPYDQYFSQNIFDSDRIDYAVRQNKNSEVVGRLDTVKSVGSGKNRSTLEKKLSNTPRKVYQFGTPPRDGFKTFEMFVPRSPDQPHSFAGYSKLLYSGYPKILAAKRLQDMSALGINGHFENLFTTPSKKNEPTTARSSTHKEQTIGSGSTLNSTHVEDDQLANANSQIMDLLRKKETRSALETAKLSGKHQGQLQSSQHKKKELGNAEKRLQMILALDQAASLVKRDQNMTMLNPPTLIDLGQEKEDIIGLDMFTERDFSKSELEKSNVGTGIVLPKENQDSSIHAKPSAVVDNDICSASAVQTSPAKEDALIEAEKRMQAYLMAKSAQTTPMTSGTAFNRFTSDMSTKADKVPHITSEGIETLKTVSNKLPMPYVMDQLNQNTIDDSRKPETGDSLLCSPVKDDEFADAHRRMMKFLKTKGNKNGGKTFRTSSTGNEVKNIIRPTSQEPAVVLSEKNSKEPQLDQAEDSELEDAAERMQKFLASKQTVLVGIRNINVAASAQSQTSKTEIGLLKTADSETQNFLSAATSLCENNSIMMNNKVTSETSEAIGCASLEAGLSTSAGILLSGNKRKTAIIQGTLQTSPAKEDAILEAEKRMQAFLAAKQARLADKKILEPTTIDLVRNTRTSISQQTDTFSECNPKQPQVNQGDSSIDVDNTAKQVPCKTTNATSAPLTSISLRGINTNQPKLNQAEDSELEEAAKRMHIFLASKQPIPAVTRNIILAASAQSQTSMANIGIQETPDSETLDFSSAGGTPLCKNNTIVMNCKVTSETSPAITEASLEVGSSVFAKTPMVGSNRKTAIIQGTSQTSPAKEDAISEAEKRMRAFLAAKQAKSADKNLSEPTTGDLVRNTKTSISQQSVRCSECNPKQLKGNRDEKLDDVDNTVKQKPCNTSAPLTALNQQEINANQPKLNQAEDSELAEAAKRMQAFLASKQATPVGKQDINVTKLIPTKPIHTEPAAVDTVIKANEQLESVIAKPSTDKTELELAKITDNKTHGSSAFAGKSQDGNYQKTAVIQGTSRSSPAKEDAILEAAKRMQAFLAAKQTKSAEMKLLEPAKLAVNCFPADKAENSAKPLDTGMTVKNKLPLLLVLDHSNENSTTEGKNLDIEDSLLCSPVKDDEIANAHRRMMEFLKTKGNKNGGKTFQTSSTGNEVRTVYAPISQEPAGGSNRKTAIIQGTFQTSPAKEDAIFKAEKRMQAFFAAKQSKSADMKLTEPTTEDLVRNTETPISQQTDTFPDCNPKQLTGNQGENVDDVDSTAKQELCKITNVTSAPLSAISLQGINTNQPKLNQEEDSELEKAAKRMQKFLASKQPIPAVTRNIIVAASVQSQTCSVATDIQSDKVEKSAKLLGAGVTTSPAKNTEIEEASKKMLEFLVKKETAAMVTPVPVVTGITPKSCATPSTLMPIVPILPNPVPLLEAVKNTTIATPEKVRTNVAEENDQMTPIGKGESERDARVSTPTRFISSPELSIPSTPIQSPEKPVAAEIEVKQVVVVQPPPSSPPIVMPGDPMWLAQQMAMLFGHPMLIQPCIEDKPKVVEAVVPLLSLPVNCEAVSNALIKIEVTKRLNEIQSHTSCQLTIHHSTPKKSCLRKPDLFDNVPDYISHAKTPCQTPMKLQFEKKTRPPKPIYNRRERLRRQPINLIFPGRAKKSVKFQCEANLISKEPTYDEVVNGGGSGFKILSIVDYNTNTVCYPKYIPPSDFCRK